MAEFNCRRADIEQENPTVNLSDFFANKKADTVVSAFNLRYKLYLRDINYFAASAASWIASRNADMEIVQEALRSSAAGVSV